MQYTLPPLPYGYDQLEPLFDQQTMHLHHSKHHQTYIDKFNAVLSNYPILPQLTVDDFLMQLDILIKQYQISDNDKQAIINHGGGHANHSLFWSLLRPPIDRPIDFSSDQSSLTSVLAPQLGKLTQQLVNMHFAGLANFISQLTTLATAHFGSGWAWVVFDNRSQKWKMMTTINQDSPLLFGCLPVLAVDLWEHAYYLRYQNRRSEYLFAFWQLVNWQQVEIIIEKIVISNALTL